MFVVCDVFCKAVHPLQALPAEQVWEWQVNPSKRILPAHLVVLHKLVDLALQHIGTFYKQNTFIFYFVNFQLQYFVLSKTSGLEMEWASCPRLWVWTRHLVVTVHFIFHIDNHAICKFETRLLIRWSCNVLWNQSKVKGDQNVLQHFRQTPFAQTALRALIRKSNFS